MNAIAFEPRPAPGTWPRRRWALLLALLFAPLALQYVGRFRAAAWAGVAFVGVLAVAAVYGAPPGELASGVLTLIVIGLSWSTVARLRPARDLGSLTRPPASGWKALALTAFGVLLLVTLGRAWVAEPMRMPSNSMQPGLRVGDVVWVWKAGGGLTHAWGQALHRGETNLALRRGDLVVFEAPASVGSPVAGVLFLQRVVALPGDWVEVRGHRLWLNGQPAATGAGTRPDLDGFAAAVLGTAEEQLDGQRYRIAIRDDAAEGGFADLSRRQVPPGYVFVLGDYRDNALDSRAFGLLDQQLLVGRVQPPAKPWP